MKWAASVPALAVAGRPSLLAVRPGDALRAGLLPAQKEIWDQQTPAAGVTGEPLKGA